MPKTFLHNKILLRFLRPALIAWAVVAMCPCPALAQSSWVETDTLECIIRFRGGSSVIEPDFEGNRERICEFERALNAVEADSLSEILEVSIVGSASLDGRSDYNKRLSQNRALAVKSYLGERVNLDPRKFTVSAAGPDYSLLAQMVDTCGQPWAAKMAQILRNTPLVIFDKSGRIVDGKEKQMMDLEGGKPYRWMSEHLFPAMRSGIFEVTYTVQPRMRAPEYAERVPAESVSAVQADSAESVAAHLDSVALSPASLQEFSPLSYYHKGYFALKTNLLMDALTMINAELEVPIGKQWSGMVEWTFPFWRWERKQYREEVLMWNVELRKWFAPVPKTATCHPMRGLFVGAYAGSAVFDVEFNKKGYKSKSSLSAGLTVGISKYIGRDWRLEFSAGAGFFTTEVMEHDAKYSEIDDKWHSVWQRNRRFTWIGPTKLKISISWYPQFKHRLKHPDVDQKGGGL